MRIIRTLAELHAAVKDYRCPALVPTMGGLHQGHLDLVRAAKPLGDLTIVTIFVNRLQFAPHEDFDSYPRALQEDCEKLKQVGCDLVFSPSEKEFYPEPQMCKVTLSGELADSLEGEFRPGFFTGVATVVTKLLCATRAKVAVFGKKDYQQWLVICHVVAQLNLPVDIIGIPITRSSDGLALSSRNAYLSEVERMKALELNAVLNHLATLLRDGHTNYMQLEQQAKEWLNQKDWQTDYIAIRNKESLGAPNDGLSLVVLGAAKLGSTRLIDNVEV